MPPSPAATRDDLQAAEDRMVAKVVGLHARVDESAKAVAILETKVDRAERDIVGVASKIDAVGSAVSDVVTEIRSATREFANVKDQIADLRRAEAELRKADVETAAALASRSKEDADAPAFQRWLIMWREALTPRNILAAAVIAGMLANLVKGNVDQSELMQTLDRLERMGLPAPEPEPESHEANRTEDP